MRQFGRKFLWGKPKKVLPTPLSKTLYKRSCPRPSTKSGRAAFAQIHGIDRRMTENAPTFDVVWHRLHKLIGRFPLVAHNKAFDEKCIKAAFRTYGMDYPDYTFLCTVQKARRTIPRTLCASFSLPSLCGFLGIPFSNHHNALADAEACAKIAMAIL